jgi:hypothetical protein
MADETKKIDWTKIWSFIKSKIFVALIIIGLIAFSAMQCSRIRELKRQKTIDEQNEAALKDSVKTEKTKNGELQFSIASFIASEKQLKDLNKDLANRVKAMDGDVLFLTHTIVQLRQDSAMLAKYLVDKDKLIEKLLKIDDHTYAAPWTLPFKYDSTNFDIFTGKTYIGVLNKDPLELAHINTDMIKRTTQIDLTWGQEVVKGQLRVFVKSKYPGFTVKSMEGVLIDPADWPNVFKQPKRHWFQGFGVGPEATMGYNITTGKYGVVLGLGVHYTIYKW